MAVFLGEWQDVEGIKANFEISDEALQGANILVAGYWYGDYEGDAFVLYEREGDLFEVNGSHGSWDGLEGQWEPELTTIEALKHRMDNGHGMDHYAKQLRDVLNTIKPGDILK